MCVKGDSTEQKTASLPTQTRGPQLGRCFLDVEDQPDLTKFVFTESRPGDGSQLQLSCDWLQTQALIQISFPPIKKKAPPISEYSYMGKLQIQWSWATQHKNGSCIYYCNTPKAQTGIFNLTTKDLDASFPNAWHFTPSCSFDTPSDKFHTALMKGSGALCLNFSPLLAGTALLSHQPLDHPGPQGNSPFLITSIRFQKSKQPISRAGCKSHKSKVLAALVKPESKPAVFEKLCKSFSSLHN